MTGTSRRSAATLISQKVEYVVHGAPAEMQPLGPQGGHEISEHLPRFGLGGAEIAFAPTRIGVEVDVPELQSECPVEHLVGQSVRGFVHVDGADQDQIGG